MVFTEIPTQHTSGKDRISGALMAVRPVYSGVGVLAGKKPTYIISAMNITT